MITRLDKLFDLTGEIRYSCGWDPVCVLVAKCEMSKKTAAGRSVMHEQAEGWRIEILQ